MQHIRQLIHKASFFCDNTFEILNISHASNLITIDSNYKVSLSWNSYLGLGVAIGFGRVSFTLGQF